MNFEELKGAWSEARASLGKDIGMNFLKVEVQLTSRRIGSMGVTFTGIETVSAPGDIQTAKGAIKKWVESNTDAQVKIAKSGATPTLTLVLEEK